ncbi:hydroxymethylcytosylglucuronate/cytosylglucuronate synthase [Streptomyces sp. NPDC004752]
MSPSSSLLPHTTGSEPHHRPSIAIAGDGFGWGSVGLLGTIHRAARLRYGKSIDFIGLDTHMGRPVLEGQDVSSWMETDGLDEVNLHRELKRRNVAAAVVVLNARLATRLEAAGCPVIYVDTNPDVWTERGYIPRHVTRYCAQLCRSLPRPSWPVLRGIDRLRWVGGIVVGPFDNSPAKKGNGRAILCLGGLESPCSTSESIDGYLQLVVDPMLRAFKQHGFHEVIIAGNVEPSELPLQLEKLIGLKISGGRLSHERFLQELRDADTIATSPGRGTLLEITTMGKPAVVLPPQNLSHLMTHSEVSEVADPGIIVPWPEEIIDPRKVMQERAGGGEDSALRYMYRQIISATGNGTESTTQLMEACSSALEHVLTHRQPLPELSLSGSHGATDIVTILHEVLEEQCGITDRPPRTMRTTTRH